LRYRPGMEDQSMALVATFATAHDATLARALLESAGIPAYLRNENVNRLNIVYAASEGGLHLYVPAIAEQEARDILASHVSEKDLEAQSQAGPRGEE
jgi:hypothetical protein